MHKLSKDDWRTAIAECRNSGMPIRSWCIEHKLSHKAFYYWERKLREDNLITKTAVGSDWVSMDQIQDRKISYNSSTIRDYNSDRWIS